MILIFIDFYCCNPSIHFGVSDNLVFFSFILSSDNLAVLLVVMLRVPVFVLGVLVNLSVLIFFIGW